MFLLFYHTVPHFANTCSVYFKKGIHNFYWKFIFSLSKGRESLQADLPIIGIVLILCFFCRAGISVSPVAPEVTDSRQLWKLFSSELPAYMREIFFSAANLSVFYGFSTPRIKAFPKKAD